MMEHETVMFTFTGCTEGEALTRAEDSFRYSVVRVSPRPVKVLNFVVRQVGYLSYEVEFLYSFG